MPTAGAGPGGNYVLYSQSINVGGSRNWRNNNPGNMEAGPFADSHGATGSDGRFAIFPDAAAGMKALKGLLGTDSYQQLTIQGAMERYAPPDENDTDDYILFITERLGLDASTKMSNLTPQQLTIFAEAIDSYEGGREGTTYKVDDPGAPSWVQALFVGSEPDSSKLA
jgi:hypothetical protein